jgi:hypothetical protein
MNTITDICSCLSVRKTVYVRKVAALVGLIISTYSVIVNIVYKGNNTITEQSYKGKVKIHKYINRQNLSTTGKL